MKILQYFLLACVLVFSTAALNADTRTDAEVLLFGVFHFANPGLDVVKTSQIDVMTAENQLGFRIAKKAGLRTIQSFDEREIGWQAEALFAYMPDHDPATKAKMDLLIEQITSETQQDHATKSLADLILLNNDSERDQLNKYMYIMSNHVGAGENFVGADAAASWWHRNFRMYANIQKHATPGARVLAIGGQGHMAILKDLLALDRERVAVDVRPYIFDQ